VDNLDPEIRKAQLEYAARPFVVRWEDSHFSMTARFHTFDDAFDYVQDAWASIQSRVSQVPYSCSKLYRCYLETPDRGRIPLTYWLLVDDVSSY